MSLPIDDSLPMSTTSSSLDDAHCFSMGSVLYGSSTAAHCFSMGSMPPVSSNAAHYISMGSVPSGSFSAAHCFSMGSGEPVESSENLSSPPKKKRRTAVPSIDRNRKSRLVSI